MWRIPTLSAVLVLTLTLPACSGTSSEDMKLPGSKEFGLTDAEFTDHVERTQSIIASCMKRAGFDYLPVDVATIERAQAAVRTEPGLTERQYKEKWGLAITTRFDNPVYTIGLGPNAQMIEGLPPAQRTAYELTLLGPNKEEGNFAFALDEEDFDATGGCTREAVSQVFTPDQLTGNYVNPKDVLVEQDPRIRQAQDKWTTCMQDQGYPYKDDQGSIIEDFQKRLAVLLEGSDQDPQDLIGERLQQLKALQADEIKVALVDMDCQIKHVNAVEQTVETEIFGHPVGQ